MTNYKKDYYQVLSLRRDCNSQDIKKSYRVLALKWHPDKHNDQQEATSKFNEISEAYSVLTDPKQRQIYNNYGYQGIQRYRDNGDVPSQTSNCFAKGFQGTDKSAFEVLFDILREEEDETSTKINDPHQAFNDLKTNLFGFMDDEDASGVDNNDHFLNNYQPTFMQSEFLTPLHQQSSLFVSHTSSERPNAHTPHRHHHSAESDYLNIPTESDDDLMRFFSTSQQNLDNSSKQYQPSIIIIDDDEEEVHEINKMTPNSSQKPSSSWISQLNDFQIMLDEFHQDLEENLSQSNGINSNSKKIAKRQKSASSSPQLCRNMRPQKFDIASVQIFS